MMNHCLFCKIASGEIPSEKIYEDENVLAFLDIQPRSPGHTMIIPKNHAANLSELPDSAIGPFFSSVKKVTDMLKKALTPDGFTLGMNYGAAAGQEVQHMHFHIMPRWFTDGGGPIQRVVSNTPDERLEEMAEKIRGAGQQQ
ncbi:MAG: hypothetical protein A3C80_04335 [Candidatus Ryanbacteria bacterium RIFCSPHIGHO2_02_FULL_45_43]|uniref:HIT domain-containing protein n=1 Tax=Candidatus Ryanbacteria bacterium RIFCSPHIGHO2_01_45_13 TaxID=1802112 RepID=A0A1G2FY94_9BACT|nr:MAG: hypothetical protein A2718_00360 [Candidatus Ryanbacteria bacterium RIFCSPHIGHO2_01_FULL_44_130]OGZ42797.1 MAG: hypothetical protein A2W41_00550 [Candidatus Ryanbacteria bacterium RIFCSPHIGHO2_01_45_13]OGZ48257.1 MAG: hypothetical protein A3C80_04335 [Candidatus Ryanbacteria bacterium RIFCSPHIGHO2_02_FULL_45_43]OGZ50033.1 MAG: hypothetical protein A3E55_01995 [Candidatus Ryanbacteria bacterium RIFCSPHIGHO2_12_FULL_44_20]OGZ51491.1 MAG: hypothetical protein A3A17_01940 [Candidatus Ryanba